MSRDGLTTCLWFNGQAEQAAHYYTSIFPDSSLGPATAQPEGMPSPPSDVMLVEFTIKGERFVALNGGPEFAFNEAVSFQIHCDDQDEVDYYWDRLTADGGEEGPCGWLKDKFGVSWQVIPTALLDMMGGSDAARVQRAAEAMLQMKRLDIAALEKAYNG